MTADAAARLRQLAEPLPRLERRMLAAEVVALRAELADTLDREDIAAGREAKLASALRHLALTYHRTQVHTSDFAVCKWPLCRQARNALATNLRGSDE
jgi:hypothetical protein